MMRRFRPDRSISLLFDPVDAAFTARRGGLAPCVLSAANEAAVGLFLGKKIPFGRISECVAAALDSISFTGQPTLEDILEADRAARAFTAKDFI